MAIQMRRGLEADFNPDKMKPGEWAVSLDKKYVRMCFAPGLCFRMATYESFEEDMQEIQNILESVNSTKEAIDAIKLVIDEKSTIVAEKTEQALQYADVATQKAQEATDASNSASESATISNAYATSASESADMASTKATEASQSASNANASSESASNSAATATLKANDANTSATNASNSADIAQSNATLSESYAVGGTGTREGEDTDNAKYYYEQAKAVSNVDIATTEKAGVVKPDGTSVTIDLDGTLHAQTGTNIETLNDVGDVNISNPTRGQALTYNDVTNKWENMDVQSNPINSLDSYDVEKPLSANMGRVLNSKILNMNNISDLWNASSSYNPGDLVINDNMLWKCLVANTNTEPAEGTYWTQTTIDAELSAVNSSLTVKTGVVTMDSSIYSPKSALRKSGNIVEVYVYGQLKKNFATEVPLATIPLEYAPKSNVDVAGRNSSGLTLFRIDTNGNICSVTTALNTDAFITVQATYIRE